MNYKHMCAAAREASEASRELGFDLLTVSVQEKTLLGIRLALGVVCRENIHRRDYEFHVTGEWQGRSSGITLPGVDSDQLASAISELREQLSHQSPDKEHVPPAMPQGSFTWFPQSRSMDTLYSPEVLYPAIERHLGRVREKGLRGTGYLEAQELRSWSLISSGTEVETWDHGLTVGITVDNPRSGASGVGRCAAVFANSEELDRLIGAAVNDAMNICADSENPADLKPGDYTVILSPSAVLDLMQMAIGYGMLDRRQVDEGRTFLSTEAGKAISFPEDLILEQRQTIQVPGGVYSDTPMNHRFVPCGDVSLVRGGRVESLYTSAFWAQKTGHPETHHGTYGPPLVLEAAPGGTLHGRHKDLDALIADTKNGVFVADTWYIRMVAQMEGTLTGMTRDGIFAVKDGKIAGPLRHMRWHDNPLRVLAAIDGLTDEKRLLGRARLSGQSRGMMGLVPAVRVRDFHFSSCTEF